MTERALHLDPRLGKNAPSAQGQADGLPADGAPIHLQGDQSLFSLPQPESAAPGVDFSWGEIPDVLLAAATDAAPWAAWLVLLLFAARYALLLAGGVLDARRYAPLLQIHRNLPPVSLIVPITGQTACLRAWLAAALELDYPEYEILLVNDGLADDELMAVKADYGFERFPEAYRDRLRTKPVSAVHVSAFDHRLRWLEKGRGGRADAVNAALNCARFPLVCVLDVHLVFKVDFLGQLAERYARMPDAGAAVTPLRIADGANAGFLARWQQAAWLGLSLAGAPLVGLFDKEMLLAAGGFRVDALDPENQWATSLPLQTRLASAPEPLVFEPACRTWRDLARKHADRQQARMECLNLNRKAFWQGGWEARAAYLLTLIFKGFWPVIELSGYGLLVASWLAGWLSVQSAAILLAMGLVMGLLPALGGRLFDLRLRSPHFRTQTVSMSGMAACAILRPLVLFWEMRGLLHHEARWGRIGKLLKIKK